MQGRAAETIGEHAAKHRAVIHVQPFGCRNQGSVVAGPGELARLYKEVDMEARKAAGSESVTAGGFTEPRFPFWRDVVVADIGGIADEQRRAVDRRKRQHTIID